ncbi:LysR family transcriptional regulator [Acinetobacter sp.]|jgi:DNA-binding transcriptional LysR family regulator|uniref:LysR family transcriptional regulator n=1 Tax=Acinetobacter sp. TaxID=472 RepID=UPI00282D8D1C|nr:LysR family transcriptional regulator [Acinetobacter sp.]MDR2249738.1 LysR family transcriptional regulator [Acinetobacter sp.]
MKIKLRRIEVFMAVIQNGSFSAAANALDVAQSAVSITIRDLEKELGTNLFIRSGRKVELTESGRLLKERATPVMNLLMNVKTEIRELENLSIGQLRIAAPAMVTQFALSQVLPQFMALYPKIHVKVYQAGALEIEDLVKKEVLDLGLTVYKGMQPKLETEYLWNLENVACVSSAFHEQLGRPESISWDKLLSSPLAIYPTSYHQRDLVERYAAALGVPLNIILESENPALILSAVRSGLAITTLPIAAIENEPDIIALKLPNKEGDSLKVGACWSSDRPLSSAAVTLLKFLKSYSSSN